jgi:hypothetical protein
MGTFSWTPGTRCTWNGVPYVLLALQERSLCLLCCETTQQRSSHPLADLLEAYRMGDLFLVASDCMADLAHYPASFIEIAQARLQVIQPLLDLPSKDRTRQRVLHVLEQVPPTISVSVASCYRWLRAYQDSGQDVRSLIPRYHQRGAPRRGRFPPIVESLTTETIETLYFRREETTVRDLYHEVTRRVHEDLDPFAPIPSQRTIARRIAAIPPSQIRAAKIGASANARMTRQYERGPRLRGRLNEWNWTIFPLLSWSWPNQSRSLLVNSR